VAGEDALQAARRLIVLAALEPRAGEISAAAWYEPNALPSDRSDSLDVAAREGWLTARASPETTRG
jgi:hypothetical protein